MADFLWLIAILVFCLFVLIIGFILLIWLWMALTTIVKYKPKSYAQYKEFRKKDIEKLSKDAKNISNYKDLLFKICDKNIVTEDEIKQLTDYISKYNLSEKQVKIYAHKAFDKHYKAIQADGLLSDEEVYSFLRFVEFLKIDQSLISKELNEIEKHIALKKVASGILPVVDGAGIILQKSEVTHFVIQAFLMEERVISRGYQGSSQGVSVRIAKGLTYRVGQSRGKLVSEKGIVAVDEGDFIITNQRLIFSGSKKSFSYEYKRLLAWNMYSDGILINIDNGPSRTLVFSDNVGVDAIHFALSFLVKNYDC